MSNFVWRGNSICDDIPCWIIISLLKEESYTGDIKKVWTFVWLSMSVENMPVIVTFKKQIPTYLLPPLIAIVVTLIIIIPCTCLHKIERTTNKRNQILS